MTVSGGVKCWGYNEQGQLGNGTFTDSQTPVDVIGLPDRVKDLSAGASHVCAITILNQLHCWGSNLLGELGNGTLENSSVPVSVTGLYDQIKSVRGGWSHTCALTINGDVKCWGNNSRGQLGNETEDYSTIPIDVVGIDEEVTEIGAGGYTVALPCYQVGQNVGAQMIIGIWEMVQMKTD